MDRYSSLTAEDLVVACVDFGDQTVWEEFVRRFHPVIASVAVRIARRWRETSPAAIDDLVQEIHLKFCENNCELLRKFEPRHPDSIFGYIKVVSAKVTTHIKDQARLGAMTVLAVVSEEVEHGLTPPPARLWRKLKNGSAAVIVSPVCGDAIKIASRIKDQARGGDAPVLRPPFEAV